MSLPKTQTAVALPAKRTPLIPLTVPVYAPSPGHVLIRVLWTASTPLDLHRADGGLLIEHYPSLMGSGGAAGTIVAVGSSGSGHDGDLKGLLEGQHVVSFAFHGGQEANHQEYIMVPAYLVSQVPDGMALSAAVTVPVNLATVFHAATADLGLDLPWPIPQDWVPPHADEPILVWGAASSVGVFALQVLTHWGYRHVLAVASEKHHARLRELGAGSTFDYHDEDVVGEILEVVGRVPFVLDCIGSMEGTLKLIREVVGRKSRVAVMLPVIMRDASDEEEPVYEMDVDKCVDGWIEGVIVRGVRTHHYLSNDFYKDKLQPEIVPALLREGVVVPNRYRVVEGKDVVERAERALSILRRREVSGERLVWRVAEGSE